MRAASVFIGRRGKRRPCLLLAMRRKPGTGQPPPGPRRWGEYEAEGRNMLARFLKKGIENPNITYEELAREFKFKERNP